MIADSAKGLAGLARYSERGVKDHLMLMLKGKAMQYGFAVAYIIAGALLGAPAGQEFKAGVLAANQVCHLQDCNFRPRLPLRCGIPRSCPCRKEANQV